MENENFTQINEESDEEGIHKSDSYEMSSGTNVSKSEEDKEEADQSEKEVKEKEKEKEEDNDEEETKVVEDKPRKMFI
jgi:hypothetical protein